MKILNTLGLDISKLMIDVYLFQEKIWGEFKNSETGFRKMMKWIKINSKTNVENMLFCCEHTGLYSLELSAFMNEKELQFAMISGLEIKLSLGIQRGKSDPVDAKRISEYAFEKKYKIKLYQLPSKAIITLKSLHNYRKRLVRQRAGYKVTVKEFKRMNAKFGFAEMIQSQEKLIKEISKIIDSVEKQINKMILNDDVLSNQYKLLSSIKGIGKVIARSLIIYTAGFSKFENWRQFSCFIGAAPFGFQSGTSIKGKAKTHYFGHKQIKADLTLGAFSAIQNDPEIKAYYHRRISQNKNEMSTINIVRNKLLARAFAVIQRNSAFVNVYALTA